MSDEPIASYDEGEDRALFLPAGYRLMFLLLFQEVRPAALTEGHLAEIEQFEASLPSEDTGKILRSLARITAPAVGQAIVKGDAEALSLYDVDRLNEEVQRLARELVEAGKGNELARVFN